MNKCTKKVVFISNGVGRTPLGPSISGGDIRWIEVAKKWQEKNMDIIVLTTLPGYYLIRNYGLNAKYFVTKLKSDSYNLFSYLERLIKSYKIPKELKNFKGIIYSTTEHWYDVIPGYILKKQDPSNLFVVVAHWVAPLFREKSTFIKDILFYINQQVGYHYSKLYADIILAVSTRTAIEIIKRIYGKNINIRKKVVPVEAGINYNKIRKIANKYTNNKKFDAVFMKRFNPTKGVFDVIDIWSLVTNIRKDAKLVLVGTGDHTTFRLLFSIIEKRNLKKYIKIVGPIFDETLKIKILASSKLLLLPSYEENWAIIIGESLAAGTPVISYDLPELQDVWKDSVIWVKKGNKQDFARKVLQLLDNEKLYKKYAEYGPIYVKKYEWKLIADKEKKVIERKCINK